jgi:hypothetical protein
MQHSPQPLRPQQQRRSLRRLWFVLSIVALVLLSYGGARVFATRTNTPASTTPGTQHAPTPTQPPTPTPVPTQPTVVLTQAPTQAPTLTPTPVSSIRAAILGSNILAFSTKYGLPDSGSTGSADSNTTGHYGFLNHAIDVVTQGTRVVSIVANAPDNATWSLNEAASICLAFAPPDSVYKQSATLTDAQKNPAALEMIYYSVSLSKQPLPASYSKDQNGNPVAPGTVGILFRYDAGDTSQVDACTVW